MIWRHNSSSSSSSTNGKWLLLLLVVLGWSSAAATKYCKVTLNGDDITDQLFVEDADIPFVDCSGPTRCEGVHIQDCEKVICSGTEACSHAVIVDFTHSVTCEQTHACHYTKITAKKDTIDNIGLKGVLCQGNGACDVARIQAQSVTCLGSKSCRKATIKADVIKCTQGSSNAVACMGSAGFEAQCLFCGTRGCADHVNMCRFKPFDQGESWKEGAPGGTGKYPTCLSETLMGRCSEELQQQFEMDLHGEEDHDEKDGS